MAVEPRSVRPSYRQLVQALKSAASCLQLAATQWEDIPGRTRLRLLRCADRAEAIVARSRLPVSNRKV